MLLFHFGWAKPVPINARNFKNPRRGFAISAMAGPAVNLVISFVSSFVYVLLYTLLSKVNFTSEIWFSFAENGILFFFLLHVINLGIAIFNLIPVPPLDGSRILGLILPAKYYFKFMEYERYIGIGFAVIVIALSYMGVSIISWIVEPAAHGIIWLFESPIFAIFQKIWLS